MSAVPGAPPRTSSAARPEPAADRAEPSVGCGLWWLTFLLVALGVACRLVRYFLRFPIWGDEAFVCNNFLERDYLGLTRVLEYGQVVPVLFLWLELTVVRLLGTSELAVRLVPLLAGVLSLGLFWRLARSTVGPWAAVVAVGMLACARWPVSMSTFVKPYSFDLLMSLVLLVPAAEWLRRPDRLRWPLLSALVTPFAVLASYPAVFVAGAVSLALLPTAWRSGRRGRSLFVVQNLLMAAAFLGSYWVVGREQLDPVAGVVRSYLRDYWADAFPPSSPWPLAKWLVLTHTGQMMAYPAGASSGGSTVTFLLFL
ncbi:MAG TPA: glycosyltransferase family 39 protein, partial [Gemmataceae bacterium]|nr:glycosyltransferase family 39 protein [Gemmataceae bacterium]